MENQEKQTSFFQNTSVKMFLIGFIALVLLIPLVFVQNLIDERSQRQKEVVSETTDKWGNAIELYGPIIRIPYKDNLSNTLNYAYFFPNQLKNSITTQMEKPLERSIYKSNVFSAVFQIKGNFSVPNFAKNSIPTSDIYWNKAKIIIQTNNLKSLKDSVSMKWGSYQLNFEPSTNNTVEYLESDYIDLSKAVFPISFSSTIKINGSESISIIPIGKTTDIVMKSNWNSPSFNGFIAPTSRNVSAKGFEATWKILHFNRPFTQEQFKTLPDLKKYSVQTQFITPVDQYQQNERAAKYGFLVIGLTFLVFFLIQTLSKINMHVFQYFMIGIALVMFYTLLIAITEHSSFSTAYIIAGVAVVVVISLYSRSILQQKKFALFIATSLTALYAFIYVIIQLEDYALLVGSIGLFAILSAVMYFSRRIEWNK